MHDDQDLEPLLTNQQSQLALVLSDSNAIDGKALAILGANIALITFISQAAEGLALWEYALLYAPFLLSFALDVASIWPRRYRGPGVDLAKHPEYLEFDREGLLLQLLANTQDIIAHDSRLNRLRLRLCSASIILTVLGFGTLLFIL